MYFKQGPSQTGHMQIAFNLFTAENYEYTRTPCSEPISKFMHIYGSEWPVLVAILKEMPSLKLFRILQDISVNYGPMFKI